MNAHSLWDGIEGIVLDAVGTLIEPVPSVAETYGLIARRQGVSLDSIELQSRFRRHFRNDEVDETRGPLVTDESIELARWRRIVSNVLPEVPDRDRAFEELWAHFGRSEAWRCFPDVGPAIEMLHEKGFKVRIASNFDRRLRAVAEGLPDLRALRDGMVISSEVGYRKPHPAFYHAACRSLDLPAECVLSVGDDPENDVNGPVRAGLRGILVDRDSKEARDPVFFRDLVGLTWSRTAVSEKIVRDRSGENVPVAPIVKDGR